MSRLSRCLVQSLTLANAKLYSHRQQAPKRDLSPNPGAPFLGVKALAVSTETEWGAAAAASHLATHIKSWLRMSSCFQKEIHHGTFSTQGGKGDGKCVTQFLVSDTGKLTSQAQAKDQSH